MGQAVSARRPPSTGVSTASPSSTGDAHSCSIRFQTSATRSCVCSAPATFRRPFELDRFGANAFLRDPDVRCSTLTGELAIMNRRNIAWILMLIVDVGYIAWGVGAAGLPDHLLGPG